jgi:hypothetical protein
MIDSPFSTIKERQTFFYSRALLHVSYPAGMYSLPGSGYLSELNVYSIAIICRKASF